MSRYDEVDKLLREGLRCGSAGERRAATRAFSEAISIVKRSAKTGTVDGQLELSSDLQEIADTQARAGLWRPAQKSFVAARKAAKKAPNVVTRRLERGRAIDQVGEAEVVAMMAASEPRAARGAAKRIADPNVKTKAWLAAGEERAKAGALDDARTAYAEARNIAAQLPDDGSRDYWMSEAARLETKAMAKAARSGDQSKGGKKARALSETAKLAEKAATGNAKALQAMSEAVRNGGSDEARVAARALADVCFVEEIDTNLALPGLLEAFTHRDEETREIAAQALESLMLIASVSGLSVDVDSSELAARLADRLSDPAPKIRVLSANALGWLGNKAAVPALVSALKPPGFASRLFSGDKAGEARSAAAKALGALEEEGGEGVDALIRSVKSDPFGDTRRAAMEALDRIGDPRALPLAAGLLDDPGCGYEARSLVVNFRDRGLVDEQQMAMLRHGLGDEAFDD